MKKPTVLNIVSLMHGDGGKYIATNLAYFLKRYAAKDENLEIALIDANRYDSTLASNLEEKTISDLTTQLKFNLTKYKLNKDEDLEEFKKVISGEYDFVIISTEIENLEFVNNVCKNKTSILVFKGNKANNSKIDDNIKMIKDNFKYAVVNCPEKTVKVTESLKENNIKVIGRIIYNELTLDNVNILKATKITKIKYLKNFKRIALLKKKAR